jgi:hypothetical protein
MDIWYRIEGLVIAIRPQVEITAPKMKLCRYYKAKDFRW